MMLQHRSPAKDAVNVNGINLLMEKLARSFFPQRLLFSFHSSDSALFSWASRSFFLVLFVFVELLIEFMEEWEKYRRRHLQPPPTRRLLPRRVNVINDFSLWMELEAGAKASWNKWNCCAVTRWWFMSTKRRNELFFSLMSQTIKTHSLSFSLRIFMVRTLFHGQRGTCWAARRYERCERAREMRNGRQ